ncbi:hypothetical protein AHAS_Ahas03G0221700 [Arachis hypogaea]
MVEGYVEEEIHRHMVDSHKEVYHCHWIDMNHGIVLFIVHWWRLLPRRLITSLRLLPPLIIPSLMHIRIVAPISYNIVRIKLIAKVRIHGENRK